MAQSDIGIVEKLKADRLMNQDYATRLRAAAIITEMVEALEAFVDAWDSVDHPFQPQMPRLYAQAKATLAKVRGK